MTQFPSFRAINENFPNVGTHDPFTNLPDDANLQLIYLIELHPYNSTAISTDYAILPMPSFSALGEFTFNYAGAEEIVRLSQGGYITTPTDSEPNRNYLGRVSDAIQIDSSIFANATFGASQSFGGIEILNPDGRMDYLYDYYWDQRDIIVKAGTAEFTYDEFTVIFSGKIASIEGSETRILLTLGDNRAAVDQQVVRGIYGGTGGADGMASNAGVVKPLAFGAVFNVQPTLINYANQIYQLHDGAITSVQYVRDRGVRLTFNALVANVFLSAPPPAGTYDVSLSQGMIRLGSTASGDITVDAVGETNAGGVTGVDLAYKILTTRLGVYNLSSAEIDMTSFAETRIASPYAQGIFINEIMYGTEVLDRLITAIDDYWSFNRQGGLLFGSPTLEIPDSKIKRIKIEGVTLKQTVPAAYEIDLGYGKNYTIQTQNNLALPTDADRVFASTEYRSLKKNDGTVRARSRSAVMRSFQTLVTNAVDAQLLLDKLFARYAVKRQVYEMVVYNPVYKYFLGDSVQLIHNRFNLDAGKDLLVTGLSENASTNETRLTVWG